MQRATKLESLNNVKRLGFYPKTVIDVGAQVGTSQLYHVFPNSHHILIEPVQENEAALQQVCSKLKKAEYIIAAATSKNGPVNLSVSPNTRYSYTNRESNQNGWTMRSVKGITVDTLCEEKNLVPPYLLKIDVDGTEIEVLKGCIKTLARSEYVIIGATTNAGQRIYDIINFMREQNFHVYDIVDFLYRPAINDLWQVNVAFVKSNSEAIAYKNYKSFSPPGQIEPTEHSSSSENLKTAILASYPRSGNHLVRFLLEFLTGCPTYGCLRNQQDVPIYKNQFPTQPNVLQHVNPNCSPIAIKHHTYREIQENLSHKKFIPSSILLIVRNPLEAIAAHIGTESYHYQKNTASNLKNIVERELNDYISLLNFFARVDLPKEIIFYERITSEDTSLWQPELQKVVNLFHNNILSNKFAELSSYYPEYLQISASGKGRFWAGVRSEGRSYYHLSKFSNAWMKFIQETAKEKFESKKNLGVVQTLLKEYRESLYGNLDETVKSQSPKLEVHEFDNGIQVYKKHLTPEQLERYQKKNVHEAEEEDIFIETIRSLPERACFVNIGSAIGYYPILAKKLSPSLTIHVVEPLEKHRKFFLENIDLNRLNTEDFILHKEPISTVSGYQNFIDLGYGSQLQLHQNQTPAANAKTTQLKTISLQELMERIGSSIDFLQMDVQGIEADILRSGQNVLGQGTIKNILIGTHGKTIHNDCVEILKHFGYKIIVSNPNTTEQPDGIILATHATYQNSDRDNLYRYKQILKNQNISNKNRHQIAIQVLELPPNQLKTAYQGKTGQIHQKLIQSGIREELPTEAEQSFIKQIADALAAGFNQPKAINYLLAAMLYCYPHQLPLKYQKAPIPTWFAKDYLKFMFATPNLFQKVGEVDTYYRYWQGWLHYIHQNIVQNPQSSTWNSVAQFFVENANFIPLYFTQTANLKEIYIQRAKIVEFALQNRGFQLNHTFPQRPANRRKIRLGILKEHFQSQTETFASLPVFEYLNRNEFEIYLYALNSNNSQLETYCRNCADRFVSLPKDLKAQVETIRNDDLDVLFFASNLTAVNRATTFLALHRLARVQTTSICSPVSTGMETMDCYIAGNFTAPLPQSQAQYCEYLANIEGSGICFDFPLPEATPTIHPTRESWGANEQTTVFISGANFYKIIPEVRETWAKILAATENSILVLYPFNPNWTNSYPATVFVRQMQAVLEKHGVDTNRLVVVKALPTMADIKACLKLADIYLDSFPYSGATSLVDPLSIGLPTVVTEGDSLRFRQAAAMLKELQIPELIATNENNYIQLAMNLANNPQKRQQYRDRIWQKMQQTPPFLNPRAYAEKIAPLFKQLVSNWQSDAAEDTMPSPETKPLPTSSETEPKTLPSNFANRVIGCVNLYQIDPSETTIANELRQLRQQLTDFWLTIPSQQLSQVYQEATGEAYRSLLHSGFQKESLTASENERLQELIRQGRGLNQSQAINALMAAMLYLPAAKMRVANARDRLPEWFYPEYEKFIQTATAKQG